MCASRLDSRPDDPETVLLDSRLMDRWRMPLDPRGDKTERGTVLVIGGSRRTSGAALLSGTASLRVGAGRVQIVTADQFAHSLAMELPEALVEGVPLTGQGGLDPELTLDLLGGRVEQVDTLLIGPGLEDPDSILTLMNGLVPRVAEETIVVVDALALQALPRIRSSEIAQIRGKLILTPNAHEVDILAGDSAPLTPKLLLELADRFGAVISAEGLVVAPNGARFATDAAVPGLGTSG
jgi:ADP-dependent NAD(P)H-hydrate dehydratase